MRRVGRRCVNCPPLGAASLSAELQSVKKAHVNELFQEAMSIREQNPKKALKLFEKVRPAPPSPVPSHRSLSRDIRFPTQNWSFQLEQKMIFGRW